MISGLMQFCLPKIVAKNTLKLNSFQNNVFLIFRCQAASPFYHSHSSQTNPSVNPPSPQNSDPNISNESAASINQESLKFSIDNILKADFGRSKILDPITIRKSKPPCRRTSAEKLSGLAALHVGEKLSSFPGEYRLQEKARTLSTSPGILKSDGCGNDGEKGPVDLSPKGDGACDSKGERGKDGQPILWPAWVYCTRYSDRPSSGKILFCFWGTCRFICKWTTLIISVPNTIEIQ